jgi:AcrR family transcriptional regulator
MNKDLILHEVRPTRSDAVKNRELLLETAQRLFAEHGVSAVSMSAVAQAAGVGKGTLYRHFANKTELCQELIDSDQRDLQERTLRRLRENPGDPLGSLRWFLPEVIAFINRNLPMFSDSLSSVASMLGHPAHAWWRQTIRGLLRQINREIDVDYTADVLFVMVDTRTIYYQQMVLGYTTERIIDGLFGVLERLIS